VAELLRPPLDVPALRREVAGQWREVRVVAETGSTNADVAELARSGEPAGLVLVAEYQTAARGRLDRRWTAPARSGLTFSMLMRPDDVAVAAWTLLPLLVGVAVAAAVEETAAVDALLKWPNDVLVGDRKLAGILAERVETPTGPAVVVGVGLNVTLAEDELPVPTATSLVLSGASCVDRTVVLGGILSTIARDYTGWRAADGVLLPRYRRRCATLGREVRVELPGGVVLDGRAVDVDSDGSLVVETAAGRRSVTAGDVVHVR
jgi:BirA family biotin operon repressor/biotin-[acetyl-CoA-carboxylase] ligase